MWILRIPFLFSLRTINRRGVHTMNFLQTFTPSTLRMRWGHQEAGLTKPLKVKCLCVWGFFELLPGDNLWNTTMRNTQLFGDCVDFHSRMKEVYDLNAFVHAQRTARTIGSTVAKNYYYYYWSDWLIVTATTLNAYRFVPRLTYVLGFFARPAKQNKKQMHACNEIN